MIGQRQFTVKYLEITCRIDNGMLSNKCMYTHFRLGLCDKVWQYKYTVIINAFSASVVFQSSRTKHIDPSRHCDIIASHRISSGVRRAPISTDNHWLAHTRTRTQQPPDLFSSPTPPPNPRSRRRAKRWAPSARTTAQCEPKVARSCWSIIHSAHFRSVCQ